MNVTAAEELLSSSLNLMSLDFTAIQEARKRFLEYQNIGVIKKQCAFDDEVWYTTDEYSNIGLHFTFNVFSYKNYETVFGMSFPEFILYVKTFLVSLLGQNALSSIQTALLDLRHITNADIDSIFGASENVKIMLPQLCEEFFLMLPNADENVELNRLIDAMESYADINFGSQGRKQRSLADFDTYFLFDEILRDYWRSPLSHEERMFYYPLYLWWRVTGVIPLRPREFLLTQRNCLFKSDADYYLRLRRNQLKGSARSISYKLSDDYSVDTYKIPTYLGEEFEKYIAATAKYENNDLDTLFVTDPHYKKWGQKKHDDSRFLTYSNMNTILKYFFKEVICGKYGIRVKNSINAGHLPDGEIQYVHLGDTRHIALINLMQQGGTPVVAMLLAGHTNTITASHYYSNLENLIEVKTYRQYRKLLSGNVQYQISAPLTPTKIKEYTLLSNGGRCYSPAYKTGQIDDCIAVIGDNGEIGYCPACEYYRKKNQSFFNSDDIYKRTLQDDCDALSKAVSLVRAGKGNIEDIGEVLLKLQASSTSYERYLAEKYCREAINEE